MAERKKDRIFLPLWWSWVVAWGIGVAGVVVLSAYNSVAWTQDTVTLALLGSAGFLGAFILTNLLWFFSDRNRVLFQLVFLALWSSAVLSVFLVVRREDYVHTLALVERIEEARIALRQQAVERAKRTQEEMAAERERVRKDPFLQYQGQVSEEILTQMRALQESVIAELTAAREHYETALIENDVQGPGEWLRIETLDELEVQRARHEAIYAAAREYDDFLQGFRGLYEERLGEAGFLAPADRFSAAEMERVLQYIENSGSEEIRRLDTEITTVALRAVDLLLNSWGEWSFDRRTSRVVFQNPSIELQFGQLLSQAQMLSQAQRKVVREIDETDR